MSEQKEEQSECNKASNSTALLSAHEIELLEGMIEVQLYHAARCDTINNRVMAVKQKGWDMERVELLRKIIRTMGA